MSLETPDKIRSLQRKLYCKAKAEPNFTSGRRHKVQGRGTNRFSREPGVRRTRSVASSTRAPRTNAVGLAMKSVGKPDAGNPHVRFDERGRETGRLQMAQATAPFFASTQFSCGC